MKLNYRELGSAGSRSGALVTGAVVMVAAIALLLGSVNRVPAGGSGSQVASGPSLQASASQHGFPQLRTDFASLPLVFEPNQGQSDARVKFLARGAGYGLFLTADEAVLTLQHSALSTQHSANRVSVVRMGLAGANANSVATGADLLPGKSNYFIGNNPAKWHRDVPQFARVRYPQVYPGIDLVYYGNQGRLEYDFEVAPGADPGQVRLKFDGTDALRLDGNGDLVLASKDGNIRLQAPRVYQKSGESQQPVRGRFVLRGKDQVGFEIGTYDRSRQLVIDPVLTYSTYLGGTANEGCLAITGTTASGCPAIAVDSAFNIYVAGPTTSSDFPIVGTPFQPALNAGSDVFVAKFNPSGTTELAATYLGGSGTDTTAGIAVDAASQVYIAGNSTSADFPVSTNAFQAAPVSGGSHVVATVLTSDFTGLVYSTYLSGDGLDTATGVALDFHAKMYLTGTTASTNFPTTATAFQLAPKATHQFFMTKLDPVATTSAGTLAYSSYVGGAVPSNGVVAGGGIAVDPGTSNVFITGGTTFTDMGLNSPQTQAGGMDAIVARFDLTQASSAQEKYLAYIGGSGDDVGYGIAVDTGLDSYVTGSTTSTDVLTRTYDPVLPTTLAADTFQANNAGGTDAFVMKSGTPCTGTGCTSPNVPFIYFSYLGGSQKDVGYAIAVDSSQGARITGSTASSDFHLLNNGSVQAGFGGGATDAFVARIDTTAVSSTQSSHFSTFLGGGGADSGTAIAIDPQGNTFVAGETASGNFPTLNPFQGGLSGGSDAFITRLGPTVSLTVSPTVTPTPPVGVGNQVTFKYTITNAGDAVSGVSFLDTLAASGSTFISATASPGSCGAVTAGTVLCNIGTLNGAGIATVTVIVTPTVGPTVANAGAVQINGAIVATANPSAQVNDFSLTPLPSPTSVTVDAGKPATYQVSVTPSATPFPNTVTLSCSGTPSGATCMFTTSKFTNLDNGAVSTTLNISTTVRPPPAAASLFRHQGPLGPLSPWLPVSGLALVGLGMSGTMSRKRRLLGGLVFAGFVSLMLLQAGCGTSGTTPTPVSGTPAGTYPITITATSGTVPHSATVQLVVK